MFILISLKCYCFMYHLAFFVRGMNAGRLSSFRAARLINKVKTLSAKIQSQMC